MNGEAGWMRRVIADRFVRWKSRIDADRVAASRNVRYFTIIVLSLLVSVLGLQCVFGLIISFNYTPSTDPLLDNSGSKAALFQAMEDVYSPDGIQLYSKGEFVIQPRDVLMDTVSLFADRHRFALVEGDEKTNQAWYSTRVGMSSSGFSGRYVYLMHRWLANIAMLCVYTLAVSWFMLRLFRFSDSIGHGLFITTTLLITFAAWCGSLLPWDERAIQGYSIVRHVLDADFPVVGPIVSAMLHSASRNENNTLMRVFLIHAMCGVAGFAALLFMFRRTVFSVKSETYYRSIRSIASIVPRLVAVILVAGLVTTLISQGKHAEYGMTARLLVKPDWYLQGPYLLLMKMPSDLVSSILMGSIITLYLIAIFGTTKNAVKYGFVGYIVLGIFGIASIMAWIS